ncbi:Ribosomal protein S30 protein [Raphanus sativus]|nr:Ribosomal protein S30 protein [Raphanus sativus]
MGKVHGSLARAGKVRGQTPKVAKQDKKKKPRGRAHKRLQHNRRFVTADTRDGRKNEEILFDVVANVHDTCSCQLPKSNRNIHAFIKLRGVHYSKVHTQDVPVVLGNPEGAMIGYED